MRYYSNSIVPGFFQKPFPYIRRIVFRNKEKWFLFWQRYVKLIQCTALWEMHHGYSTGIYSRISVSQSFKSEVKLCPQVMMFSFHLGMNIMIFPQFRSVFPGAFGRNARQNRHKQPGRSPLGRFREYKAHLHGSFLRSIHSDQ